MKAVSTWIGVLVVAVVVSLGVNRFAGPSGQAEPKNAPAAAAQTAYDRVLASGVLRAGYVNYPPGLLVDAKTKELNGIFFDVLKKIGQNTGLKVEYVEEVGWATTITGLDAGRYDIIGSPVWANSTRGKLALLSRPVYFSGVGVWVRSDEERFNPQNNWETINRPEIKIAAMDGSTPEKIARAQFPKATLVTYPDLTGEPQLFLDVVGGKVDVFFAEPSQGIGFLASNPGKVKNIASTHPIKIFPTCFMMKGGEYRLKSLIDTALEELEYSGYVDGVIRKYEPGPNAFYRVAQPYRVD